MMITGPTALPWSATFTSTGCKAWFGESRAATAAVGQQPNPLKEREVEEAAMPGQAETLTRYRMPSGNSPSRIASCY